MKRIMFDVDGVLADFTQGFTATAHAMYGSPVISHKDYSCWNMLVKEEYLTKEQNNKVWEAVKRSPSFWTNLNPLVNRWTFDRIEQLCMKNYVYFVTSRVSYHNAQLQTSRWLYKWGVFRANVVITPRKGEFAKTAEVDFSIEDKAENAWVIAWLSDKKCKSYLIDRPYNRLPADAPDIGSSAVERIETLEQFLEIVETA